MAHRPDLAQRSSKLYKDIREGILEAVYTQWQDDHLFYEMYHAETGKGLGTAPFNGWTSLILLIATEKYH